MSSAPPPAPAPPKPKPGRHRKTPTLRRRIAAMVGR